MTDLDRAQTEAAVAPPGHEWEMATDQLGTETRRSTLLIQPGRRYREQGEDRAGGCDGDRSWLAIREGDGWNVEADDGPEPPLPPMLRPSWLLTGYTLEAGEPVTVGEREALRLVATPRPGIRLAGFGGDSPARPGGDARRCRARHPAAARGDPGRQDAERDRADRGPARPRPGR